MREAHAALDDGDSPTGRWTAGGGVGSLAGPARLLSEFTYQRFAQSDIARLDDAIDGGGQGARVNAELALASMLD